MTDKWNTSPNMQTFGRRGYIVTPSNSIDLSETPKAIQVVVTGNLAFIPANNEDDEVINLSDVPFGYIPPLLVRRVMATGTTATLLAIDD